MSRYIVALTGASGSAYGMRITEQLLVSGHEVVFVATEAGAEVAASEIGFHLPPHNAQTAARTLADFLEVDGEISSRLRVAYVTDRFDDIASGSARIDGMFAAPCTVGFVSAVATGASTDLAQRAADCVLKERKPLVLVVRETPLSLVHLRNMTAAAEAGASIVPATPAFYQKPTTIDDLIDFVAGKALDVMGVEHELFKRWGA